MLTHSSYLIQRLKKPYIGEVKTPLKALCKFGLAATGFNKELSEALSSICRWDYMGSAEYEFGAIPRTLRAMASLKLTTIVESINYTYRDYRNNKDITGILPIYIIAQKEDLQEVTNRIKTLAIGELRCKERPNFDESLAEYEYSKDIYGWLELNNGYMFFKDEVMYAHFCALSKVKDARVNL